MLYSHMRFFIAGVEMPVSGPIYATGGGLTANLVYVLDSYDDELKKQLRGASPLARSRFENVPVLLAGSKPKTTIAEVEAMMQSTHADESNYTVLFCGSASMQIAYNPDTCRLDLAISAVPGTVKALNNIVYNNLTIGSYVDSVEQAVDTTVAKAAQSAEGNKTIVTGVGPNSMNSSMFIKKVVTGKNTQDIERPTDIIEYALANILQYADTAYLKNEGKFQLYSKDIRNMFITNNSDFTNVNDAGNDLPDYIKHKFGASQSSSNIDHGESENYYSESEYNCLLPDYIMRKATGIELYYASLIGPAIKKIGDEKSIGKLTWFTNTRTNNYIKERSLWIGNAWPFKYFFPKNTLVNVDTPVPDIIKNAFVEAGKEFEQSNAPEADYYRLFIQAGAFADPDGRDDRDYKNTLNVSNLSSQQKDQFWRVYSPEFAALVNGYIKSYLTVLGLAVLREQGNNETVNILTVLYDGLKENTSYGNLPGKLNEIVGSVTKKFYKAIVTELITAVTSILNNTLNYAQFTFGYGVVRGGRSKYTLNDYYCLCQPTSKEWAEMLTTGKLAIPDMDIIKKIRDMYLESEKRISEDFFRKDLTPAWVTCLHNAVNLGITYGMAVIKSLKATYGDVVISYSFLPEFKEGTFNPKNKKDSMTFISSINSLLSKTYSVLKELTPKDTKDPEPGDPSLFDVKASKEILDYSVQNKVGSIGFMRLKKSENGEGVVFPNLKLTALSEFHQLISNTSSAEGNGAVTLYSLLAQLYSNLRLGMFLPLNKPYANQPDKQNMGSSDLIDKHRSVLETMILPMTETWLVPKCNVFCVDKSRLDVSVYDATKNVTDVLIRYQEPVGALTGTDTNGSVPAQYFKFNVFEPEKIYKVSDPKAAFSNTRSYNQGEEAGAYDVGYKMGHVYDMYKVTTIDVSQEAALLAKLCCRPKDVVKVDEEAIDQALNKVPNTLRFSTEDIVTMLSKLDIKELSKSLTINVSIGGQDDPSKNRFIFKDYRGGPCEFRPAHKAVGALAASQAAKYRSGVDIAATAPSSNSKSSSTSNDRYDDFTVIYQAASYQFALHCIASKISDIRQRMKEKLTQDELETLFNTTFLSEYTPTKGTPLYDELKSALAKFASYYLKRFSQVDTPSQMSLLRWSGNKWEFEILGEVVGTYGARTQNSYESYPNNHLAEFASMLTNKIYQDAAEELMAHPIWRRAFTDIHDVYYRTQDTTKGKTLLWVTGRASWQPTGKSEIITGPFNSIFNDSDYLVKNLTAAYLYSGTDDTNKTTKEFIKSLMSGSINVSFPEPPYYSSYNILKDTLTPARTSVLNGIYRTVLQIYSIKYALVDCVEKNYTTQLPNKPDFPKSILDNIIHLTYTYESTKGVQSEWKQITVSEAAGLDGMEGFSKTLNDDIFRDNGKSGNILISGLTVEEDTLKQIMSPEYYVMVRGGVNSLAGKEYVWEDHWWEAIEADSPFWSYLVNGSSFISIVPPKKEVEVHKAKTFHTLVTPYFFTKKASSENQDILPKFPHLYFDYSDEKEVDALVEGNDNLSYYENNRSDTNFSEKDRYVKKDYAGKERYVLLPMGGPSKPDAKRAKQYIQGKYTQRSGTYEPVPMWPFVVFYDRGSKASIIYYDMYSGTSTNPMTVAPMVPEEAFKPKYHYFNLANPSDNQPWVDNNPGIKSLFEYIQEVNPFNNKLSGKAFDSIKDDPSVYIIYPFKMDQSLKFLRLMLNIPVDLLGFHMSKEIIYNAFLRSIDSRAEVSKAMVDYMSKIKEASKGAVYKNETYNATEEASAAGSMAESDIYEAKDKAFQLLFGVNKNTAAIIPANGGYNPATGCKDNGAYAVARPLTGMDELFSDLKAIRPDEKGNYKNFHIHGGVDIGIKGHNSYDDKIKGDWVNNNYTPKYILAPYDSLVVYGASFGTTKGTLNQLTGYGFHAIVVPASKDLDANYAGFENNSGKIPVILIGHMTPSTTIKLAQLQAIVRSDLRVEKLHYEPVLGPAEKAFKNLWELNKTCSATNADNYYFNDKAYLALKDTELKDEIDKYMSALRKAFHQTEGLLSNRAFVVPAGWPIGTIGNSGGSRGLHYHCNFFMIDKQSDAVREFYSKNNVYQLASWARGSLSDKKTGSHFEVENASDWGVMGTARDQVVKRLETSLGIMNIHEALGKDTFYAKLWEDSAEGMTSSASIISGLNAEDLSLTDSMYRIPSHILISVVESRSYQEAVNRLCSVIPEPVNLPYYDPYVIDAGMPAAIMYKNDIILAKCVGVSVVAASTGAQTSVNFANGISVSRLVPLYLRAVKFILDRNSDDQERTNILRQCALYPFHSLDFYNRFAGNVSQMNQYYLDMFGKSDFVFDWRLCTEILVDGGWHTIWDLVEGDYTNFLSIAVAQGSYTVESGTLRFNLELAMPLCGKKANEVMPKFENQLLLSDRAWGDDNMYTLALAALPQYKVNLTPSVPILSDANGLATGEYEKDAVANLEKAASAVKVSELPGLFYDWGAIFKVLRKSIKTQRLNVSSDRKVI